MKAFGAALSCEPCQLGEYQPPGLKAYSLFLAGFGFKLWGLGFKILGLGFKFLGLGCRVYSSLVA